MGVLDGYNPVTLQFVADALRTFNAPKQNLDLTKDADRHLISTILDTTPSGHESVRNADGTALTIAQIATAANLTSAQVQDIASRLYTTAIGRKKKKEEAMNRINIVVPSNFAAQQVINMRDEYISKLLASIGQPGDLFHYVDNSPLGMWSYFFSTFGFIDGIYTVASVSCSGVTTPPDGSYLAAVADPGVGTSYSSLWVPVGALPSIVTSADSKGISPPAGNNNFYVWRIPANSPAAATDFTTAVTAIGDALAGGIVTNVISHLYLKYVDSISGAWQVNALYFGAGSAEYAATTPAVIPNNNIQYVVTCAGTPHPPAGSSFPAVTIPSFAQSFTTITAPLSFGPQR